MSMLNTLTTSGHQTDLCILDNEASSSLRQGLINNNIKYQLVPPQLLRLNAAERAIQTFKAHFITCFCADDPVYPAKEWYCFLPQSTLTLNLLCNFCFNPKLSAHVALHGTFEYNKTALSPLGTRVLAYEKPENCRTWAPCGTNGWYIGQYLEHYLCV